ncbi:uncharacterized protein LOC126964433 [Leptidea sinapis]|uniref:uncharacterized protein LOC126964433 n=1 Tax=Leptidea sinapis TaxID=189913 RepID=UPI00212FBF9E|nr:uncharacterized protein LOC126964433 [Leptidea sinapis]
MEWDDSKVLQLVELYRAQEVLWNPWNKDYKNRPKRYDALYKIASELSIDVTEIERKIKNVTSHYYREKKKVNNSKKTDNIYRCKWFAYKSLSFLKNNCKKCGTNDTDELEMETTQQEDLPSTQTDSTQKSAENNNKRRKKDPNLDIISQALDIMKSISQRQNETKEKDEDSLFGEYIAASLKKMDQSTKAMVKHRINNIIFEGETRVKEEIQ